MPCSDMGGRGRAGKCVGKLEVGLRKAAGVGVGRVGVGGVEIHDTGGFPRDLEPVDKGTAQV